MTDHLSNSSSFSNRSHGNNIVTTSGTDLTIGLLASYTTTTTTYSSYTGNAPSYTGYLDIAKENEPCGKCGEETVSSYKQSEKQPSICYSCYLEMPKMGTMLSLLGKLLLTITAGERDEDVIKQARSFLLEHNSDFRQLVKDALDDRNRLVGKASAV